MKHLSSRVPIITKIVKRNPGCSHTTQVSLARTEVLSLHIVFDLVIMV